MTILDQMTDEKRDLVASLPYRVGLWISESDQSGGDNSDEQELKTLDGLIQGFSGDVFGSELLQYIMADTVAKRDQWARWSQNLDDVPGDCEKAVDILRMYADEKEVNAYVSRLMEIAEAVALAFREQEGNLSPLQSLILYIDYLFFRMKAKKHQPQMKSFDQFLYISPHERKALNEIARRLGTRYI